MRCAHERGYESFDPQVIIAEVTKSVLMFGLRSKDLGSVSKSINKLQSSAADGNNRILMLSWKYLCSTMTIWRLAESPDKIMSVAAIPRPSRY